MPTSNPSPPNPPNGRPRPVDALERLYAYWIISTAVLLFAVIIATVYLRGALSAQAREYNRALSGLAERVGALEVALAEQGGAAAGTRASGKGAPGDSGKPAAAESGAKTEPARARPERTSAAEQKARPGPGGPAATRPTSAPADRAPPVEIPPEAEVQAQLDRALVKGAAVPYVIADQTAAEGLLTLALQHAARAKWSGATWGRLAVLARLLWRDSAAETFAQRAYGAGDPLLAFAEVSARTLLRRGRAQEARLYAEHLAEQTGSAPTARLLLARVFLALESPATADELLTTIEDPAALSDADKLTLARVCLELHLWNWLMGVMQTVQTVPAELEPERNFLQAVSLIQQNQHLVEALSMLEFLADRRGQQAGGAVGDPPPSPNEYEVMTWRGVALLRGRQVEAARRALDEAAVLRADRPEAYYWRAMLEIREDQLETAKLYLQNALATCARFAPAWEALGSLALNAGNVEAAIENLEKAIAANERQASSHFLLALAHAKASRREPAAAALKKAFRLDPGYLETARQTDVLTRLFTLDELNALATAEAPGEEDGGRPAP